MKKSILLIISLFLVNFLFAQEYEAGVSFGGTSYVGDIGRTNYIYPNKFAGALFFKYNWNPRIALKATYSYLPIMGDDLEADTDFRVDRGISFSNNINELGLGIEYNFYEYNLSEEGKTWTPYLLIELVGINYKYISSENSQNQFVYSDKNTLALPFGIGIKSKLVGKFAVSLEAKFRYTFDDDIDYTTDSIESLNFGTNKSDWYTFTGVSLIYTFGRPPCYTEGF